MRKHHRPGRSEQRPAKPRPAGRPDLRSTHGCQLGHFAAGHRRHALRRVRPAPGFDHVHAAQPISCRAGGRLPISREPRRASPSLCPRRRRDANPHRRNHPLLRRHHAAVDQSLRAFAVGDLSFNLSPGFALGDAVKEIQAGAARNWRCRRPSRQLSRNGASLSGVAAERALADPGGAGHRLHRAGHPLRELYPSHHDSLHASLGGVGALLACSTAKPN